jgi:DNA-binding Lrp family transcriptional regulator
VDKLLQLLERNSNISPDRLAKMLGTKVSDVKKKIAAYEKSGIIMGYRAIVNHHKLDHERVRAVIEVKVTPEREGGFDRTAERISQFEEVTSCFLMSGGFDILLFIEGKTLNEVASFVSSKLAPLEQVQSTATHFMLKAYKDHGMLLHAIETRKRLAVTP